MKEYTTEELVVLPNEMIKKIFLSIRSQLFDKKINYNVKKNLEIYYCYIEREIENRNL
jgi:hypothetical protein